MYSIRPGSHPPFGSTFWTGCEPWSTRMTIRESNPHKHTRANIPPKWIERKKIGRSLLLPNRHTHKAKQIERERKNRQHPNQNQSYSTRISFSGKNVVVFRRWTLRLQENQHLHWHGLRKMQRWGWWWWWLFDLVACLDRSPGRKKWFTQDLFANCSIQPTRETDTPSSLQRHTAEEFPQDPSRESTALYVLIVRFVSFIWFWFSLGKRMSITIKLMLIPCNKV